MELLGRTIDDAVGEAYDKAGTLLGLPYPGGPKVDALAATGDDRALSLPVSRLGQSLDFSFSGLKTALLYAVRGQPVGRGRDRRFERDAGALSDQQRADYAASFQRAAIAAIMLKVERVLDQHPVDTLLVGGGVSANTRLRRELEALAERRGLELRLPPLAFCLDNAAMIAGLAAAYLRAGRVDDWTLSASPRTALGPAA
jgi:N6-L-threonylcarbamoyladenine synthase